MDGSNRGFFYLVIGVIVAVAALFAINKGMEIYHTNKLEKEALEVMEMLVTKGEIYTEKKEFEEYAKAKYKEKGYTDEQLEKVEVAVLNDGSIVLYNEESYVSIWGSIIQKEDTTVRVAIIGYKDKYSDWKVEKYDDNKEYKVYSTTTAPSSTTSSTKTTKEFQ